MIHVNSKAKILIIDDRIANVEFLMDLLEMEGYENIKYSTDSRAVESLVRDYQPDIILLDLMMPYLNGFDILKLLKNEGEDEKFLPVIVLTADISNESKKGDSL